MPEAHNGADRRYPIRIADEFIEGLAHVWSHRVLDHIKSLINLLATDPELGSTQVRASLVRRYGANLRKLTVSTFVIIYRFDGSVIDVLALVYGPSVL